MIIATPINNRHYIYALRPYLRSMTLSTKQLCRTTSRIRLLNKALGATLDENGTRREDSS